MKNLFISIIILFIGFSAYSQDIITKVNGEKFTCQITKEDSTAVYFTIRKKDQLITTFIDKSEIASIKYFSEPNQDPNIVAFDKLTLGIGLGMDYGGIGGSLLLYPHKNIGIFGALGYAFAGVGYNVGIKVRTLSEKHWSRTSVFGVCMYGYNAAVKVTNATELNRFFYGPTIGSGIDVRSKRNKNNYWTFTALIPFRSSEVDEYVDYLKLNRNVEFKNELVPFAISIGYRIKLN